MSRPISRGELLVVLAFLVVVVVELRTVLGFVGIDLSATEYLVVAALLVAAVLGAIGLWNIKVGASNAGRESSGEVR